MNSTIASLILEQQGEEMDHYEFIINSNVCVCTGELGEQDYSAAYAMYNFIVIIILLPLVALFAADILVSAYLMNQQDPFVIYQLKRHFFRSSMIGCSNSVYLAALAVSDFLVVLTGVFIFCLDSMRSYVPAINLFATTSILWILPIGYMAQTGSVYFTVGAALDCYLAVCWQNKIFCKPRKACQFVALVFCFTVFYNTLRFWQFFLHKCLYHGKATVEICTTSLYNRVNLVYNVYMYMILMTFLPFILLSILNAFIVRRVQRKNVENQTNHENVHQPLIISSYTNDGSWTSRSDNRQIHKWSSFRFGTRITTLPILRSTFSLPDIRNPQPYLEFDSERARFVFRMPRTAIINSNSRGYVVDMEDVVRKNSKPQSEAPGVGDETVTTMIMVVILFLSCNFLALIINIVETFASPGRLVLNFLSDTSNFLVVFNSSVNFVIYMYLDEKYSKILRQNLNDFHLLKRIFVRCCPAKKMKSRKSNSRPIIGNQKSQMTRLEFNLS